MDFCKAIAACDLKSDRFIQLIEFMKVWGIEGQCHDIDLGPRPFNYEN